MRVYVRLDGRVADALIRLAHAERRSIQDQAAVLLQRLLVPDDGAGTARAPSPCPALRQAEAADA